MDKNIELFIKDINKKRLSGGWYMFNGIVNNKSVVIKGYKTWLQIFKVNDYTVPCAMEISVKEFKELLLKGVS